MNWLRFQKSPALIPMEPLHIPGNPHHGAVSMNGNCIAIAADHRVQVYDRQFEPVWDRELAARTVQVTVAADGRAVAVIDAENHLSVFTGGSGTESYRTRLAEDIVALTIAEDGSKVAVVTRAGQLKQIFIPTRAEETAVAVPAWNSGKKTGIELLASHGTVASAVYNDNNLCRFDNLGKVVSQTTFPGPILAIAPDTADYTVVRRGRSIKVLEADGQSRVVSHKIGNLFGREEKVLMHWNKNGQWGVVSAIGDEIRVFGNNSSRPNCAKVANRISQVGFTQYGIVVYVVSERGMDFFLDLQAATGMLFQGDMMEQRTAEALLIANACEPVMQHLLGLADIPVGFETAVHRILQAVRDRLQEKARSTALVQVHRQHELQQKHHLARYTKQRTDDLARQQQIQRKIDHLEMQRENIERRLTQQAIKHDDFDARQRIYAGLQSQIEIEARKVLSRRKDLEEDVARLAAMLQQLQTERAVRLDLAGSIGLPGAVEILDTHLMRVKSHLDSQRQRLDEAKKSLQVLQIRGKQVCEQMDVEHLLNSTHQMDTGMPGRILAGTDYIGEAVSRLSLMDLTRGEDSGLDLTVDGADTSRTVDPEPFDDSNKLEDGNEPRQIQ